MNILVKISLFALSTVPCFASEDSKVSFSELKTFEVETKEAKNPSTKQQVRKSSCCKKFKTGCDSCCNRKVAATGLWVAGLTVLGLGIAFWLQEIKLGKEIRQYEQIPELGATNCYGFRYGTHVQGKSDMRFCYSSDKSLANITATLEQTLNKINVLLLEVFHEGCDPMPETSCSFSQLAKKESLTLKKLKLKISQQRNHQSTKYQNQGTYHAGKSKPHR